MQFAKRSSLIIRMPIVNAPIDKAMGESICALFRDARCYLHDLGTFYQTITVITQR